MIENASSCLQDDLYRRTYQLVEKIKLKMNIDKIINNKNELSLKTIN